MTHRHMFWRMFEVKDLGVGIHQSFVVAGQSARFPQLDTVRPPRSLGLLEKEQVLLQLPIAAPGSPLRLHRKGAELQCHTRFA